MSSKLVDERVVEMQFDNRNFDRNINESIKSIDKLKASLDFSAVEIAAMTAISNITNKLTDMGLKLAKSLSIDQLTSGWSKYESKSKSVGTLLSQGLGLAEVEEAVKELQWYTDETSYSFDQMFNNMTKFTAAGRSLEEATKSVEGMANWAAATGQNAQTASMAMYQLTQGIQNGYIKWQDWQQGVVNHNMVSTEVERFIADVAASMDAGMSTLTKITNAAGEDLYQTVNGTELKLEELFSQGGLTEELWFTADVFVEAMTRMSAATDPIREIAEMLELSAYDATNLAKLLQNDISGLNLEKLADEYGISVENLDNLQEISKKYNGTLDEQAIKFFQSAQECRTLGDAIGAVKEAVSSDWSQIWETMFGDYNQGKELWSSIFDELYTIFVEPMNKTLTEVQKWRELGGWDDLFGIDAENESYGALWNVFHAIEDIIDLIGGSWKKVFSIGGNSFKSFTEKLKEGTAYLRLSQESIDKISNILVTVFSIFKKGLDIFKKIVSVFKPVIKVIFTVIDTFLTILDSLIDKINYFVNNNKTIINIVNSLSLAFEYINSIIVTLSENIVNLFKDFKSSGLNIIEGLLEGFKLGLRKIKEAILNIGSKIIEWFNTKLGIHSPSRVFLESGKNIILGLIEGIKSKYSSIKNAVEKFISGPFTEFGHRLESNWFIGPILHILDTLHTLLKDITLAFIDVGKKIKNLKNVTKDTNASSISIDEQYKSIENKIREENIKIESIILDQQKINELEKEYVSWLLAEQDGLDKQLVTLEKYNKAISEKEAREQRGIQLAKAEQEAKEKIAREERRQLIILQEQEAARELEEAMRQKALDDAEELRLQEEEAKRREQERLLKIEEERLKIFNSTLDAAEQEAKVRKQAEESAEYAYNSIKESAELEVKSHQDAIENIKKEKGLDEEYAKSLIILEESLESAQREAIRIREEKYELRLQNYKLLEEEERTAKEIAEATAKYELDVAATRARQEEEMLALEKNRLMLEQKAEKQYIKNRYILNDALKMFADGLEIASKSTKEFGENLKNNEETLSGKILNSLSRIIISLSTIMSIVSSIINIIVKSKIFIFLYNLYITITKFINDVLMEFNDLLLSGEGIISAFGKSLKIGIDNLLKFRKEAIDTIEESTDKTTDDIAETVTNSIAKVGEKVVDSASNFIDSFINVFKDNKDKLIKVLDDLLKILTYITNKINSLISNILSSIIEGEENLIKEDKLSGIFDNLLRIYNALSGILGMFVSLIESILDKIATTLEISVDNKNSPLASFFDSLLNLIQSIINALNKIIPFITKLINKFTELINGFNVKEDSPLVESIYNLLETIFGIIIVIIDRFTQFFNDIKNNISEMKNGSKVMNLILKILPYAAIGLLLRYLFENLTFIGRGIKQLRSLSWVTDGLTDVMYGIALFAKGKAIQAIGTGLMDVAKAITLLSLLNVGAIAKGGSIVVVLLSAILSIAIILNQWFKNIQKIEKLDPKDALERFKSITSGYAKIAALLYAVGGSMLLVSFAISKLANTFKPMLGEEPGKAAWRVWQAFILIEAALATIGVGIFLLNKYIKKELPEISKSVIELSLSMLILSGALTLLAKIYTWNQNGFWAGILAITAFSVILGGLIAAIHYFNSSFSLTEEMNTSLAVKKEELKKNSADLSSIILSISSAILEISLAVSLIAFIYKKVGFGPLLIGTVAITVFAGLIVGLMYSINKIVNNLGGKLVSISDLTTVTSYMKSLSTILISFGIAISLIAGSIALIAASIKYSNGDKSFIKAVGIVVAIMTALGGIVVGLNFLSKTLKGEALNSPKLFNNLLAISVAVGIISIAIAGLSFAFSKLQGENGEKNVTKAVWSVIGILTVLSAMIFVLSNFEYTPSETLNGIKTTMITLTVLIGVIGLLLVGIAAVWKFMGYGAAIAGVVGIIAIIGSILGLMTILNKLSTKIKQDELSNINKLFEKMIPAIIILGLAVGAMWALSAITKNMDPKQLLSIEAALLIMMGLIAGIAGLSKFMEGVNFKGIGKLAVVAGITLGALILMAGITLAVTTIINNMRTALPAVQVSNNASVSGMMRMSASMSNSSGISVLEPVAEDTNKNSPIWPLLVGAAIVLSAIAIVAGMAIAIDKMKVKWSGLAKIIIIMASIIGSIVLVGLAIKNMEGILTNPTIMTNFAIMVGVLVAAMAVMMGLGALGNYVGPGLLAISTSMLVLATSLLVLGKALQTFLSLLTMFANTGAEEIINSMHNLVSGLTESMNDIETLLVVLAIIVIDFLGDLLDKANSWFDEEGKGKISTLIQNVAITLGEGILTILQVLIEYIPEIIGMVRTLLTEINKALDVHVAGGEDMGFLEYINASLTYIVMESIVGLIEGIASGLPKLGTAIGKLVDGFLKFISEVLKGIGQALYNNAGELKEGLDELKKGLRHLFLTLIFGEDFASMIEGIGSNLVEGLKNGLAKGWNKVKDVAGKVADGVVDLWNNIFDINSPSKVTEKMGEYLDKGLAIGLEENSKNTEVAAENVATNVSNAISEAINSVNDDMNNGVVIRPVLDLSEIQNGTYAMSNMLNGVDAGVTANLNAARHVSREFNNNKQNASSYATSDDITRLGETMNGNGDIINATFNITGNDPKAIAKEVEKIMYSDILRRNINKGGLTTV